MCTAFTNTVGLAGKIAVTLEHMQLTLGGRTCGRQRRMVYDDFARGRITFKPQARKMCKQANGNT